MESGTSQVEFIKQMQQDIENIYSFCWEMIGLVMIAFQNGVGVSKVEWESDRIVNV